MGRALEALRRMKEKPLAPEPLEWWTLEPPAGASREEALSWLETMTRAFDELAASYIAAGTPRDEAEDRAFEVLKRRERGKGRA